jgi:hypothetical protein
MEILIATIHLYISFVALCEKGDIKACEQVVDMAYNNPNLNIYVKGAEALGWRFKND